MIISLSILAVLIAIIFYIISIYNRLVELSNRAKGAFAQIDVQLKRRYDLIPNLIEVAKKYMQHEKETFLGVTNARNYAKSALEAAAQNADAKNIAKLNSAESSLLGSLKGLNIQMEAYPELKANETMMQLNNELSSTENKIAFARQSYNDSVMNYNVFKQSFPCNIVAGFFTKYRDDMGMLEFNEDRKTLENAPKVEF